MTTTALQPAAGTTATSTATPTLAQNLRSLAIDIVVPTAIFYLLTKAFDVGLVWALTASSVLPLIRTVSSQVRERHINALAALMLTINAVGIASSFLVGDPRLMIAKDSLISSVVGFGIIVSVFRGRPMMTAALEPWLTKGDPDRTVAWRRLASESGQFRRLEVRYNLIWAVALLAECAARIVGAFTLPIATMVWLSGVMIGVSITLAIVVGSTATVPMERLLKSCGQEHPAECTRREQGAGR